MINVFKLRASVKNYEWGKHGFESFVAFLHNYTLKDEIDKNSPYAELWIGTHNSGPAVIPSVQDMQLIEWMSAHAKCYGENISCNFDTSKGLPFLFKVLSVGKALSIQAHPDKATAENLFRQFPDLYPDDNHKPEMAIALTDFKAMCGFRPFQEIREFFVEVPQLQKIVGAEISQKFLNYNSPDLLRQVFSAVMNCPSEQFKPELDIITKAFKDGKLSSDLNKSIQDIFITTSEQYPGDIGNLCFFFFNYLELKPGEAIFLAANEPHAYLFGDCIECMACSDNVIRAGLTPKYRDTKTLCNILTYDCKSMNENKFQPLIDPEDPFVTIYKPPVKEFVVDKINLIQNFEFYQLKVLKSASILLVTSGNGFYDYNAEDNSLECGSILFISSECEVKIKGSEKLTMFRAYCDP